MNLTDNEILEFDELMNLLIEETISEAQKLRLQNWLEDSKAARRRYVKFMDMNASLQHYAAEFLGAVPEDDDDPETTGTDSHGFGGEFLKPLALAACIALVGILLFKLLPGLKESQIRNFADNKGANPGTQNGSSDPSAPGKEPVAILTQEWKLQFEDPGLALKVNSELPRGSFQVSEGLAQIEFFGGTTVILEAPADINLLGDNEMQCTHGKFRVRVPGQAKGFKVITNQLEVLDLGTEFGMNVGELGEVEVTVFEGKVQLTYLKRAPDLKPGLPDAGPEVSELTAGQSVFVDPKGKVVRIEAPKDKFIGLGGIRDRTIDDLRMRYEAWLAHSQELREDQRLLLYYTFDDEELYSRTVTDQALNKSRRSDGAVVSATWSSGRWPEKGALHFKKNADRVKINVPGEYTALSLAAWVRPDKINTTMTSLLLSGRETPGVPHWQVDATGRLLFSTRGIVRQDRLPGAAPNLPKAHPDSPGVYASNPILMSSVGQWVHIVTTYDSQKNLARHYVDGKVVTESKLTSNDKITLGHVELGNWPKPDKSRFVTNFRGKVDELAIFQAALEAEEILEAYQFGRPDSLHGWLGGE